MSDDNDQTQPINDDPIEEVGVAEQPVQSDRTKEQVEKLTTHNTELKEERDSYKNLLDSLLPDNTPKPQAQDYANLSQGDIDKTLADMQTSDGYIDGNKLLASLKEQNDQIKQANDRAARAEEHAHRVEVALEGKDRSEMMANVHKRYPALDPDNVEGFDKKFYAAVRNELLAQMIEGKEDPMAAADKWYNTFTVGLTKEEKARQEKVNQQKAQINAVVPKPTSTSSAYYEQEEDEALRRKVQQGRKGAVAEALRRHDEKNKQS